MNENKQPRGTLPVPTVFEPTGTGECSYDTGQTERQIRKDSERDFWMSAQEAQQYGIVDKVVEFQQKAL